MRISGSDLRDIARIGGPGWRPRPPDAVIVTPSGIRKKALSLYHEEGLAEALAYLAGNRPGSTGLGGTYGRGGSREQQGRRTAAQFDRYVRYDINDGRPYAELGLSAEVVIGRHVVRATLDVVVFDAVGYAGRLLNWDLQGVDRPVAEMLAVPMVLLMDQQLGTGTAVEVAVWDLEHDRRWIVTRGTALNLVNELAVLLNITESALPDS
jgi:hypothetical protein